jgi:hypothetical protein
MTLIYIYIYIYIYMVFISYTLGIPYPIHSREPNPPAVASFCTGSFFSRFLSFILLASWESLQDLHTGTVPSPARRHLHLFPRPSRISHSLVLSSTLPPPPPPITLGLQPIPLQRCRRRAQLDAQPSNHYHPWATRRSHNGGVSDWGTAPPPTQVGARMCISISICSRLCPPNADPMS